MSFPKLLEINALFLYYKTEIWEILFIITPVSAYEVLL